MEKQNNGKAGNNLDAALQETFVERNWKKLVAATAVVVVVIIAGLLWNSYAEGRNQKAAEALFPCEHLFQAGKYQQALDGDSTGCIGLKEVAKQYGSTPSGNLAHLYAALCYSSLNPADYEAAKQELEKFSAQDDALVSPAALFALGNLYVQLGENEKGAETLVKAAKLADNVALSPLCLQTAAEVYESLGNNAKALSLYEQIRDNYKDSEQGSQVEKYIERLK